MMGNIIWERQAWLCRALAVFLLCCLCSDPPASCCLFSLPAQFLQQLLCLLRPGHSCCIRVCGALLLTCSHIPAGAFEVVIAVLLGICIMVVLVFIGYFFLKKRKKNSHRRQPPTATNSTLSTTEDTERLFYSSATKPV